MAVSCATEAVEGMLGDSPSYNTAGPWVWDLTLGSLPTDIFVAFCQ